VEAVVVSRGELWWLETPDEKGRPVVVISRDRANQVMQRVMVAPVTRTIRKAPSQLPLGPDEGLVTESVANFDDLASVPKAMLVRRIGDLGPRTFELCLAIRAMCDC
jgi:mRNA-degrading endonuclease toxin of MazEF toxin-antitoxin module